AFLFSIRVVIGGGGLNFPLSKAGISFVVFVRRVNLSCFRSGLCWFWKSPFLKFGLCPASCCFHDENDFFLSRLEAATSPLRNVVVTLVISSTNFGILSCSSLGMLLSGHHNYQWTLSEGRRTTLLRFSSSSTLDFCLFGFEFQCPPGLPSLSDSTSVLREDSLCYNVFRKQTLVLLSENSGSIFQYLCGYCGMIDALNHLRLPDLLRVCLDPSLFLRSLHLLGVPDSECWLHRKQACPSPADLAPFLTYSSRWTWVGWREFAR
nr:hypothetical protein [Tanacetum cinerariifolium]GFB12085.1 hypothetical protein [Tanacetum cinerariifolium]